MKQLWEVCFEDKGRCSEQRAEGRSRPCLKAELVLTLKTLEGRGNLKERVPAEAESQMVVLVGWAGGCPVLVHNKIFLEQINTQVSDVSASF